jgi:hypothetical protein
MKHSTVHGLKNQVSNCPMFTLTTWHDDDAAKLLTFAKAQNDLLQGTLAERHGEWFHHEQWCSDLEWINVYRMFIYPFAMHVKSEKRAGMH